MHPVTLATQSINSSTGVLGLQKAAIDIQHQTVKLIEEGEKVYRRINTMTPRVMEMRSRYPDHSIRQSSDCDPDRRNCLARQCSCTYADFRDFVALSRTLQSLNARFDAIACVCRDLRQLYAHIIEPNTRALLGQIDTLRWLAQILELTGDLSSSQALIMDMPGYFFHSGTPLMLRLAFGREPQEEVMLRPLPQSNHTLREVNNGQSDCRA